MMFQQLLIECIISWQISRVRRSVPICKSFLCYTPFPTSGNGGGAYTLNITGSNSQANVSTGITQTRVGTALYDTFPLAVYPVDAVLMTRFSAKPPPSPPPPAALPKDKKAPSGPSTAGGSPAAQSVTAPSAASLQGRNLGWGIAIGVGLLCMGLHL